MYLTNEESITYLLCCCSFKAVIGGGIGGTAAAYYLRQEFGAGVNIDVFEPGAVGGRLATTKIRDREYETGGAAIHPLNLHMKHFIEKLGKKKTKNNLFYASAAVTEMTRCILI